MKDSNRNLRFFLGVVILTVGLLSVGMFPSNANKTTRDNGNRRKTPKCRNLGQRNSSGSLRFTVMNLSMLWISQSRASNRGLTVM